MLGDKTTIYQLMKNKTGFTLIVSCFQTKAAKALSKIICISVIGI
jgi:hypothetical protein